MKRCKTAHAMAVLCLSVFLSVRAQAPEDSLEEQSFSAIGPWIPDLGNGNYKNPVLHADYSDPDVIRVGSDYYMTSSSFNCAPGLQILRSNDLVNWQLIGHVFDQQPPGDAYAVPQTEKGVWAPSIRFHNDTFYVMYGNPDYGIFLGKSKKPEGPWDLQCIKPVKGWIDICPFWDSDGEGYVVHAYAKSVTGFNSVLTIRRLSKDASQITDSIMVVDGNVTSPALLKTIEGPKLYKKGDYYYILAPAGGVTSGWQLALRAKSINGPWEIKKVLEQGTTSINGPHQGGWVTTPDEKESWFMHFQDKGAYGRVVHLQPMAWINDWPVIGADADGDGTGNPVLTAKKPGVGAACPVATPRASDKFDSETPGLQWQWYANPKPEWMSLTDNKGNLRLRCAAMPSSTPDYKLVPNLLLQKLCADSFSFTTKVRPHLAENGEKAGVIVIGGNFQSLSVVKKADGLYITNSPTVSASDSKLDGGTVYFRVVLTGPNAVCKFSYSSDGKSYKQVGPEYTASKIKWIGAKIGLFASKPYGSASSGYADFAWVNVGRHPAQSPAVAPPPAGLGTGARPACFVRRNPATGAVAVSFEIGNASPVELRIYDCSGAKIREYRRSGHAGRNEIAIEGAGLSPGLYLFTVKAGRVSETGMLPVE